MNREAIRSAVNGHSCCVGGIRYQFKLHWIAVERYCDPAAARHLLNIEFVATPDTHAQPARLQMLVWLSDASQVTALLDDALRSHLAEQRTGGGDAHVRNREAHAWRPSIAPPAIWPN